MMQAILTTELEIWEPYATPETIAQCVRRNGGLWAPIGTIYDSPDAHVLVNMGVADAYDDECIARTESTPAQREARTFAAKRLADGIHPEDFEKYAAGEILGYNGDGSYRPGPNWKQDTDPEEDE